MASSSFLVPIIYEDDHIIIVNKPAGTVTIPGPGHCFEDTLAGWVKGHVGESILEVGEDNRWGIVHRLDKDTSGVMVVVKTPLAYKQLREQFKNHQISKTYIALVWGQPREEEFIIKAPIGRNPGNMMRWKVKEDGKESETWFRILQKSICLGEIESNFTLLACRPITGRTHQIRVHLKALGHPVAGDPFYSGRRKWRYTKKYLSRTFLHAQKLGFNIPDEGGGEGAKETSKWQEFEAPLPEELKELISSDANS